MAQPIPMLPMLREPVPRPIDPEWKCQRSGDCCTIPAEVIMTKEEAAAVVHAAPKEITLHFRPLTDKFVALKANPCPLYAFNSCQVYAVRPYNCRRFACMRPDVKAEPFSEFTMMDRVMLSRVARRMAQRIQRHAQRWADKHGWTDAKGQ